MYTTKPPRMQPDFFAPAFFGPPRPSAGWFEPPAHGHGGGRRCPRCSNRTLRGDYGILVSGIRGVGPGLRESFVGTALRTYDGDGQFTQIDNGHGEITGFRQNVPAYGTYEVHADCSGTSLIYFPGAPSPVETAFVIVAHGDEVKDAVMAPAPNIVTASLWRVGR